MACDVNATLAAACASGIGKVTNPVTLNQLIAQSSCELAASGGGSSGAGQIKTYTADPNLEGVVPTNTQTPAVAYSVGGTLAIYTWSIINQNWQ